MRRLLLAAITVAVLLTPVLVSAPAGAAASGAGTPLWQSRYDAPGPNRAADLVLSPTGDTVYTVGSSERDYLTVAYDAATGGRRWAVRYGSVDTDEVATAAAISPDGQTVYVTGSSRQGLLPPAMVTVAYSAGTGALLWVQRFDGPARGGAAAAAIAVSADGALVFVTGSRTVPDGPFTRSDYATLAYSTAGVRLWLVFYQGPVRNLDGGTDVQVSPDGTRVYVTGRSSGLSSGSYADFATVAYDASTGRRRWVQRYGVNEGDDVPAGLRVSPDGATVVVTGRSEPGPGTGDALTLAYESASGAQRWMQRYDGPVHRLDDAFGLEVSPDSSTVYIVGGTDNANGATRSLAIAYNLQTGEQRWLQRSGRSDSDIIQASTAVDVSPDGTTVYVAGWWRRVLGAGYIVTSATDASSGRQVWARRLAGTVPGQQFPSSIAVAPRGEAVFVAGTGGSQDRPNIVTAAYATGPG